MTPINQNISSKMLQELALKPKMLQSLQLLILPQSELDMRIRQELMQNPLLELLEEEDELEKEPILDIDDNEEDIPDEDRDDGDNLLDKSIEELRDFSEVLDEFNEYHKESKESFLESETTETYDKFEEYLKNTKLEFLKQLDAFDFTEAEFSFAYDLIDNIDDIGYLPEKYNIYEAAKDFFPNGIKAARVDEIHKLVMSIDPQGITARNMKECLIAQLETNCKDYKILVTLINEYFDELIHHKYSVIASNLGISSDDVLRLKTVVSHLNPKPGLQLLSGNINFVNPDVIIKRVDDEFAVIVNDFNFSHLTINKYYRRMIFSSQIKDKKTLEYVRERINSAKFLIKSIYLRNRTLVRVTKSIMRHQRDFFFNNSGILRPLTYSVIANELGINESTVSRVVKNKFADTPFGIFCLKDFFNSTAGKTNDYENVSRQNVEILIKKIIDEEDKNNPVSDLEITQILQRSDINVSRRVIAKYREKLGILNSRYRKHGGNK